jgi:hypothetical protein
MLQILFIGLKLAGVIDWAWFPFVLAPTLFSLSILVLVILFLIVCAFMGK